MPSFGDEPVDLAEISPKGPVDVGLIIVEEWILRSWEKVLQNLFNDGCLTGEVAFA